MALQQFTQKFAELGVVEDFRHRIGVLEYLHTLPCGPDMIAIVKGAFQAAPKLAWTLFCPDPLDMTFDRLGQSHRRRRKFRFRDALWTDAETYDTVSRTAMFRVAQATQRIGWYFIVADAGLDFVINWTSLAMQYAGCLPDGESYARERPDIPARHISAHGLQVENWQTIYDPDQIVISTKIFVDGSLPWDIHLNAVVNKHPSLPNNPWPTIQWALYDWTAGQFTGDQLNIVASQDNRRALGSFQTPIWGPGERVYQLFMSTTSSCDITGTELIVTPHAFHDVGIDPALCVGAEPTPWDPARWFEEYPLSRYQNVIPSTHQVI